MQAQTGLAVEQHRAGAAIAGIAADLGAGEAEFVAQHGGKPARRRRRDLDLAAVEDEARAGRNGQHVRAPPRRRRARVCTSVSAASRR